MIFVSVPFWIGLLGSFAAVFALLAAVVPQWYVYTPAATIFGLGNSCNGNNCDDTNYDTGYAVCNAGSGWRDRERAVEAMVWISFILSTILSIIAAFAVHGSLLLDSTPKVISMATVSFIDGLVLFVGAMVYVGTMDSWLNCGDHFCDVLKATNPNRNCGYGSSFILICVIFCVLALVGLLYVLRSCSVCSNHSPAFDKFLLLLLVFSAFGTLAAGLSTRWLVAGTDTVHHGVLSVCRDGDCERLEKAYPETVSSSSNTCQRDRSALVDRGNTVAAMLIIAAIALFVVGVAHVLRQTLVITTSFTKVIRIIFLVLLVGAFIFIAIALIVFGATFGDWLYCGDDLCDANAGSACNLGSAFAFGIGALLCCFGAMMISIFDLGGCCNGCCACTEPAGGPVHDPHYPPTHQGGKTTHVTTTTTTSHKSTSNAI